MYSLTYIKQHPKKPSLCIKHLVVEVPKIYPLSTVILTSIKWLLLLSGHGWLSPNSTLLLSYT